MGQTLEQQKMIHGFKFGQESVANWGNAGNWDNSGPNVRSKISHGIGGTNNQLDMSINSDNLSDGSIQKFFRKIVLTLAVEQSETNECLFLGCALFAGVEISFKYNMYIYMYI